MPVVVHLQDDRLEDEASKFSRERLSRPAMLNSIPKSGTHLVTNILRMFVPADQQWRSEFIQLPNLVANLAAFSIEQPRLSWGHLLFTDQSAAALQGVTKILLVRDPYSWVLARARFFLSDQVQSPLSHIKNGAVSVDELLTIMVLGMHQKTPSLLDIYTWNAVAWSVGDTLVLRYEDVVAHVRDLETPAAAEYFAALLSHIGFGALPDDWRDRVRIGADSRFSATAREKLSGAIDGVPDELPLAHRRLVDFHAPRLRAFFGYE